MATSSNAFMEGMGVTNKVVDFGSVKEMNLEPNSTSKVSSRGEDSSSYIKETTHY